MGQLFDTSPENVLMHLQNIFKDDELEEPATTKEFLVVRQKGKRQVRRRIKHYNHQRQGDDRGHEPGDRGSSL